MSETCFRLTTKPDEPALHVRRNPGAGPAVLYVHGATFPAALSVAYRFEGRSWMDDLRAQGFDVWAFDFAGYGGSDRYAGMQGPATAAPLGRAPEAAQQIARVIEHICRSTGRAHVSVIAHSWGSVTAGLYATHYPEQIDKLCLFGPIAQRNMRNHSSEENQPAWRLVTVAEQLERFLRDVPDNHPPMLIEPELAQWGPAYLVTDPEAKTRTPPAVKVPGGPAADIDAAWSGKFPYRPEDIRAPTLIVRGEWDSVCNDADADWLLTRLRHPACRDVKIAKGTHLMHLERSREDMFAAVNRFLRSTP